MNAYATDVSRTRTSDSVRACASPRTASLATSPSLSVLSRTARSHRGGGRPGHPTAPFADLRTNRRYTLERVDASVNRRAGRVNVSDERRPGPGHLPD